ncbi:putative autotransporter adhesin-like protein [Flavobacterium endophyticum]|uniref:Putative autotransporter adhesin-like protein n=1 Tax=Flavobacterium endophyticum TaxID=1540163 RepID=A0A495MK81_9FLAO|nr:head GIN domain-containing protein [Flavobacterium endophyticum]RKS26376.1 putative autotransporter adhesin-like protein [Flavobacterium endophyticum]
MKKILLVAFLMLTQINFAQEKLTKNLGDFDAVRVFDRISVQLVPANENKIEITGDRRDDVEIVNKNGDLKIRMKLKKLLKGEDITAILYFKNEIETIEASEGSYVSSEATFKAIDFSVNAKEGAEIKINLDAQKLAVKATSGGIVKLKGSANNQDIVINSGGIVDAKDLETSQTTVAINAGGEADVKASELVDAKTRAGGDITIYGSAKKINKKTFAGGNITESKR